MFNQRIMRIMMLLTMHSMKPSKESQIFFSKEVKKHNRDDRRFFRTMKPEISQRPQVFFSVKSEVDHVVMIGDLHLKIFLLRA
ncbi:hypothetical protein U14_01094 [Candidatus Moduliflexus flocculans]|uniref:Uncharacterized protein n=1 Tax=Candidatus Moduliflexus flocculans TaxID=1499966 RepID=A0A0S6VY80_9BACT|nr:hypothetical protein U14_01094 [Candidatus Moduliflexus flocculans]